MRDNNLWGENGFSGTQCITADNSQTSPISWASNWNWTGGPRFVKSYANSKVTTNLPILVSNIHSIKSSWSWSYSETDIVADVAYDLFLGPKSDSKYDFEIMIWLAGFGEMGPLGSSIDKNITLAGHSWTLFYGKSDHTVYSFVREGNDIPVFEEDIYGFVKHLVTNGALPSNYYLVYLGAGTEAISGNAYFQTTSYTASIL
ncbi:Xyloglucan-specific endo-beta-1,4-glucanase A [Neolecta irregularis DAH-3]|uniref:Xyloglucan-specific endo-beta-1,4-glucanase A n=1 Tax=Neolecta irregularis (strain DAH-3) TaxID=1198029 RepID=A0A1U7LKP0_NEOID|nr:Xyloglucan-specific endo-beta-1,4-glucanase A [Neolecta irregularis DAH-3]|eukprot:OLL23217.1 Xyloglucan-specific endo-beta-1,4-glucanase A [Neolecta irregularis DAH-3]